MSDEFSRPQYSNPRGKCTTRVDVPCSEALKEALTGLAFVHKQTMSEYVRDLLEEHVWGKLTILDRLNHRRIPDDGRNEQ